MTGRIRSGRRVGWALVLLLAGCGESPAELPPLATTRTLVSVSGDAQIGLVNRPLESPLVVRLVDGAGLPVAGEPVVWSVTVGGGQISAGASTTAADGTATVTWTLGASAGMGRVTATGGETTLTFTAEGFAGPVIVDPLPIGRASLPYAAVLEVLGGNGSETWSLTAGSLPPGLALAADGNLVGTPTEAGSFALAVASELSDGSTLEGMVTLRVCPQPMAVTEGTTAVSEFPNGCAVLIRGGVRGRYRVGVMPRARRFDMSGTDFHSSVDLISGGFQIRVVSGAEDGVDADATGAPAGTAGVVARLAAPSPLPVNSTAAFHQRLREEEILRWGGYRAPPLAAPPTEGGVSGYRAAREPAATNRSFNYRFSGPSQIIDATIRAETGRLIFYEDNAIIGTEERLDATAVSSWMGHYELYGHAVIEDAFGGLGPAGTTGIFMDGPRQPGDLDGNGKVIVVQIRRSLVPEFSGGFVTSCDLLPRPENAEPGIPTCDGSNEGEVVYLPSPGQISGWAGGLIHEIKHISSLTHGLYTARGFEDTWIEEGAAELAAEKASRDAVGLADGEPATLAHIYPGEGTTYPATSPASRQMARTTTSAAMYLSQSPISGLIGNPDPNRYNTDFYGATWLFMRFLADAFGDGDEDALVRRINVNGLVATAKEASGGKSISSLLTDFVQAIAHAGDRGTEPPGHHFTSYDFTSYDFLAITSGAFTTPRPGSWPWAEAEVELGNAVVSFPQAYVTSPVYVDLLGGADGFFRVDVGREDGGPVSSRDEIVITVVKIG